MLHLLKILIFNSRDIGLAIILGFVATILYIIYKFIINHLILVAIVVSAIIIYFVIQHYLNSKDSKHISKEDKLSKTIEDDPYDLLKD